MEAEIGTGSSFVAADYNVSFWSQFVWPWKTIRVSRPDDEPAKLDWRAWASLFMLKLVRFTAQPLKHAGKLLERGCNTVNANQGLLNTAYLYAINSPDLVYVAEDSSEYLSFVGLMDRRRTLLQAPVLRFPYAPPHSKIVADVCAMASKLAYENPAVIRKVVNESWEMHLVETYNCWNEYQKKYSTQAFILADRQYDAHALVLAFRGTEAFNGYDWCTDFDFSWYKLPQLGRVHLGFLEALGLGERNDMSTFEKMKTNIYENSRTPSPFPKTPTSGLPSFVIDHKPLAYDYISQRLVSLLRQNKNAKLYITGHSLGGALAALFTAMLFYKVDENLLSYNLEDGLTKRLAAVYTFGQPRVGDEEAAAFMNRNLNSPNSRYFRIVYTSDIVPRVPFDNPWFGFKHFGHCLYFNSLHRLQVLQDEPNPNYFSLLYFLLSRLVCLWELIHSWFFAFVYGKDYQETVLSTISRMAGLLFPGLAAHSMVNYVNCVRLGPDDLSFE